MPDYKTTVPWVQVSYKASLFFLSRRLVPMHTRNTRSTNAKKKHLHPSALVHALQPSMPNEPHVLDRSVALCLPGRRSDLPDVLVRPYDGPHLGHDRAPRSTVDEGDVPQPGEAPLVRHVELSQSVRSLDGEGKGGRTLGVSAATVVALVK